MIPNAFSLTYILLLQTSPLGSASFDFVQLQNVLKCFVLFTLTHSEHTPLLQCVFPVSTLYLCCFSSPYPPFCDSTCVTLVLPSGPHWGLPLSSADNYCHLHIAQSDKHLTVVGCRTAALVQDTGGRESRQHTRVFHRAPSTPGETSVPVLKAG